MSLYKRHTVTLAGAAALAATAAALIGSTGAASAPAARLQPVDQVESPIERRVATLRRAARLPTTRHSPALTNAAEAHAATLARSGVFAHEVPGQKPFSQRLQSYYTANGFQYWATGENIFWARTSVSPAQVVRAWLASPPHKANLLDPRWRDVGVAAVRSPAAPGVYLGRDVTIVVIELGTRRR